MLQQEIDWKPWNAKCQHQLLTDGCRLTADLYQANALPAPALGLIFESKGEIQLESVCKSFAYVRKKKPKKTPNVLHVLHIYKASQFMA